MEYKYITNTSFDTVLNKLEETEIPHLGHYLFMNLKKGKETWGMMYHFYAFLSTFY